MSVTMYEVTRGVNDEVVAKLIELQGDGKDAKVAEALGVTRSHWSHLKAGRKKMSYALVKRAIVAYPAILPIVMRDLTEKAS